MALLLIAPSSFAWSIEPTRAEYVEEIEPICKSETLAHRTILRGVRGMINHGKSRQAAPRLLRASAALRKAVKKLSEVPRPPADVARLTRWLGFAKKGDEQLRKMALALQQDNRSRAQKLTTAMLAETKRANATVVEFNFDYCRLNPARFV